MNELSGQKFSGDLINTVSPILTREAFAQQVGLTAPTVYSMCDRGYLPTVHLGRRVFINLEVLRLHCSEKAF
jgi:predicted DNA-binding transcriptional regulator AlpA